MTKKPIFIIASLVLAILVIGLLGLVFSKPVSSEKSTSSKNSTSTIFRQTSDGQSKPIKRIINKQWIFNKKSKETKNKHYFNKKKIEF